MCNVVIYYHNTQKYRKKRYCRVKKITGFLALILGARVRTAPERPGLRSPLSAATALAGIQPVRKSDKPCVVVGVTDAQTCLILSSRVRALRQAGFRVAVICGPGALLDRLAVEERIEPIAIPMRRGISPFVDLVALFRIVRELRRLRPELVEFSTPKAGMLGSVAAYLCGVPSRVYLLRGLKLETSKGFKRWLLCAAERLTAFCVQEVICNSRSLMSEARELALAPESKLRLLGEGSSQGVDVERFAPARSGADSARLREQLGISANAVVIGFVGRLTRDKGVPELLQAFDALLKEAPEVRLLLVGWFDASEDALEPRLKHYIDLHPCVICTGFVNDPAPLYRIMDMMVLPTRREGFPNAVLEASASGIPVITTLATGSRDAVVSEVTGLLVQPGYPEAILKAMRELLRDPERRRTMGVAARRWVVEHFAEKAVLEHTVSLYSSMVRDAVLARDAVAGD